MLRFLVLAVSLAVSLAAILTARTAQAQCVPAALTRVNCKVLDVHQFNNRVDVRCETTGSITFFALPTTAPNEAGRLLQLGIAGLTLPEKQLEIHYCDADRSGKNYDCLEVNCRVPVNIFLLPK